MIAASHLSAIDADLWPAIASIPEGGMFASARARRAEASFALACAKAGIALEGENPDLLVQHEELFFRIAERGWLGLAEGFLAGEWETDRLVWVLSGLLASGFRPSRRTARLKSNSDREAGGELPPDLVQLYSEDGVSRFGGMFASGVRTTQRVAVKSFVRGAGVRNEPKTHFVDITDVSAPGTVEKADLGEAQQRAASNLLDVARVGQGTDLLEYPSSGGAIALLATHEGATVDILGSDPEHLSSVEEFLTLNGANSMAHPHLLEQAVPTRSQWRGHYDAIVSVEKLETFGDRGRVRMAKTLDRLLGLGGFIGLQSVVATESFGAVSRQAIQVLQAYIWPELRFSTTEAVHRLFDRETSLRVTSEVHFGSHYQETLRLQRELFESRLREAAAAGFDPVFRRLWIYQFALLEALFRLGCLDAVQFGLTARHRQGRR